MMAATKLRYYFHDDVVSFEEDQTHEFKGHTNLCDEEINPGLQLPHSEKKSRARISKVINGFLNTGKGGTIYLGILDHGTVKGLNLTLYQKDHFLTAMEDLMGRYKPEVESHRYSIDFVPVVPRNLTKDDIIKFIISDNESSYNVERRLEDHTLRTHKYCWCHVEAKQRFQSGVIATGYVIEIDIKAWGAEDELNQQAVGKMRCHPIHEDETGQAFFRCQSSVKPYSLQEIYVFSKNLTKNHFSERIERLKMERDRLRRMQRVDP